MEIARIVKGRQTYPGSEKGQFLRHHYKKGRFHGNSEHTV